MDGNVDGLGETRNIYRNSVENALGQRTFGKPGHNAGSYSSAD
jgi:hypothetical protein